LIQKIFSKKEIFQIHFSKYYKNNKRAYYFDSIFAKNFDFITDILFFVTKFKKNKKVVADDMYVQTCLFNSHIIHLMWR